MIEIKIHLPFSPDQRDCEPVPRKPDGSMSWGVSRAVTIGNASITRVVSDNLPAPDEEDNA